MDPSELKPREPDQENQTAAPETPAADETKKFSKKLVLVGVVILIAAGLALSKTVLKQSNHTTNNGSTTQAKSATLAKPKAVEQVFVSPVDGSKKTINEVAYYTVAVGAAEYYGRVSKINDDYIRMIPTAYKHNGVLT